MKTVNETSPCLRRHWTISAITQLSIQDTIKMFPVAELDESLRLATTAYCGRREITRRDIFNLTVNQGQYKRLNRKQP